MNWVELGTVEHVYQDGNWQGLSGDAGVVAPVMDVSARYQQPRLGEMISPLGGQRDGAPYVLQVDAPVVVVPVQGRFTILRALQRAGDAQRAPLTYVHL